MKNITKYIFSVVVLVIVLVVFKDISFAQGSTATVSIVPSASTVPPNSTTTVNINIANAQNMGGYTLRLRYNPAVLQIGSGGVTIPTTFLQSTGGSIVTLPAPTIDNTNGIVDVTVILTGATNNGVNGAGTIATIVFNTLGSGTSTLQLQNVSVSMANLNADLQPNIVSDSSVTIAGSGTASPSPSSSLSPSPSPSPSPSSSPISSASPQPSPSTTGDPVVILTLKVKFEGVDVGVSGANVNVRLKRVDNAVEINQTALFTSDGSGLYQNQTPISFMGSQGPYDVFVKGPSHLVKKFANQTFVLGQTNTLDLTSTLLLGGDINGDNYVYIDDPPRFFTEYTGIDTPANGSPVDINLDGKVSILDYGYFIANFDRHGDQ